MAEAVVIITSTLTSEDSTHEPIPGPEATKTVDDCKVWLTGADERVLDGLDETITQLTVRFPADTEVSASDEFMIRGDRFEAVGVPFAWANLAGEVKGIVIKTKRVASDG